MRFLSCRTYRFGLPSDLSFHRRLRTCTSLPTRQYTVPLMKTDESLWRFWRLSFEILTQKWSEPFFLMRRWFGFPTRLWRVFWCRLLIPGRCCLWLVVWRLVQLSKVDCAKIASLEVNSVLWSYFSPSSVTTPHFSDFFKHFQAMWSALLLSVSNRHPPHVNRC